MHDREQPYFSAIQNNDENAFETLFVRHYSSLVNFAATFLPGTREEAKDIVAEVFGYLWTNRGSLTLQGSLTAYLYTAVKNKTVDYLRKRKIRPVILTDSFDAIVIPDGGNPEKTLVYKETDSHIIALIACLPPQTKLVFNMNRDEGLTYEEIAGILDISVNSVKTHMYRALRFLKEQFAAYSK